MRAIGFFAILGAVVLASGLGALAYRWRATPSPGPQVAMVDYSFTPADVTVEAGTTVQWMNMDGVQHTVTFGGHGDGMEGVGSGMMGHMGSYSYTFREPGVYPYHCDPHPYMTGTVTVVP